MSKRIFCILLAVLTVLPIFCSCSNNEEPELTTETASQVEYIDISDYKIIYARTSSSEVMAAIKTAVGTIRENTSVQLAFDSDWVAQDIQTDIVNDNKEILIGDTNRVETSEKKKDLNGYYSYSISDTGNKIVICGGSSEAVVKAIEHFVFLCCVEGALKIESGLNLLKTYTDEIYSADSLMMKIASEYTVVFPILANSGELKLAESLTEKISGATGIEMKSKSDAKGDGGREILIGNTSRSDFVPDDTVPAYFDYRITVKGNKIALTAGSQVALSWGADKLYELICEDKLDITKESDTLYEYDKSGFNPICFDLSCFTPSWADKYTTPEWLLDFDEKVYAVTCPSNTNYRITMKTHRGDMYYYPENSIEAIASAILAGTDAVEFDVQQTSDGVFVLMHNSSISKMTNASEFIGKKGYPSSYEISAWTYDQLKSLSLLDSDGKKTDYKIPTLYEALLVCANRVMIQIDDKCGKVNTNSKEFLNLVLSTGSYKCFFHYYGVDIYTKWYQLSNKKNGELLEFSKLCASYLAESGHALRKTYWPNDVNTWDSGRIYEDEDHWNSLYSSNKCFIWTGRTYLLSQYVSKNCKPTK